MSNKTSDASVRVRWAVAVVVVLCVAFGMAPAPSFADVVVMGRGSTDPVRMVGADKTNDELLAGYVEQRFGEQLPAGDDLLTAQDTAGSYLTGNKAMLYNMLEPLIEQIAAGDVTSTTVALPIKKIAGQTSWSATELGVDVVLNEAGDDLAPGVDEALNAKLDETLDTETVMFALLADHPYELYWFDKTVGLTLQYDLTYWIEGGEEHLGFDNPEIVLPVAADYADEDSVDEFGVFHAVRPDVGTSVSTAVRNAVSVADAHKDEPASQRLRSFLETICAYTSYNGAAARGNVAYGDPWQLVWVFDGDPSTTVVCEGYAKAFKYLCDATGRDDVECHTVTGWLYVSQGANGEGHMWNVVRMPDDRNYVVDVTNCDGSSMGAPDKLFLAPCLSGSVADGYSFSAVTPSGSARYAYDDEIRSVFPEGELEISALAYDTASDVVVAERQQISPEVSMQGWTYGQAPSVPVLAQGSNPGGGVVTYEYKARDASDDAFVMAVPTNAGDYTLRATIGETAAYLGGMATADFSIAKAEPMLGAVYADAVVDKLDASVVVLHRTDASVAGTLTLDDASLEYGEHAYAWTFAPADEANYETVHGSVTVSVAGHAWGEPAYAWSADDATVTATRVCQNDASHTETETVGVTSAVTKAATCTETGVRTYTSDAFVNPAFAVQSKTETLDKVAHVYVTTVVEPTYEAGGYTLHRCSNCTDEYRTDQTDPLVKQQPDAPGDEGPGSGDEPAQPGQAVRSIAGAVVTVANQTYSGKALTPRPTVRLGGVTLVAGTDYAVAYAHNISAGTATVTITGKGVYVGSVSKSFSIAKAASSIKLAGQTRTYTGKALAYTGKVSKTGSTGKVTYAYYSDKACKKVVKAANVKAAGVYYVKATVAASANYKAATSAAAKLTVAKAANPMTVKAVARTAKLATVKKKAVTVAAPLAFTRKAQGKVTYAKASGSSAALSVNKTTGKVTVKKGTKKGTYTIKIKVSAAGTANYKALAKTVTCKVTVK